MLNELALETNYLANQSVELCYHCHKCTAGCPVVEEMEFGPDQVLRLVALGDKEALFNSSDIWLCAGCNTCATRCPNDIDIAAVMDALRQMALAQGYTARQRDILLFHRLFLGVVQRLGRSHEAFTLGLFKVLSKTPFLDDMGAGAGLFMRGKIPVLPKSGGREQVKKLFERSK
jgi:heterodisulfide reductase subunit C